MESQRATDAPAKKKGLLCAFCAGLSLCCRTARTADCPPRGGNRDGRDVLPVYPSLSDGATLRLAGSRCRSRHSQALGEAVSARRCSPRGLMNLVGGRAVILRRRVLDDRGRGVTRVFSRAGRSFSRDGVGRLARFRGCPEAMFQTCSWRKLRRGRRDWAFPTRTTSLARQCSFASERHGYEM